MAIFAPGSLQAGTNRVHAPSLWKASVIFPRSFPQRQDERMRMNALENGHRHSHVSYHYWNLRASKGHDGAHCPSLLRTGRHRVTFNILWPFMRYLKILIELMGESGFHCCDKTPERGGGEEVQSVKHDVQAEFRSPEVT